MRFTGTPASRISQIVALSASVNLAITVSSPSTTPVFADQRGVAMTS